LQFDRLIVHFKGERMREARPVDFRRPTALSCIANDKPDGQRRRSATTRRGGGAHFCADITPLGYDIDRLRLRCRRGKRLELLRCQSCKALRRQFGR
jgi:hypothetical protein